MFHPCQWQAGCHWHRLTDARLCARSRCARANNTRVLVRSRSAILTRVIVYRRDKVNPNGARKAWMDEEPANAVGKSISSSLSARCIHACHREMWSEFEWLTHRSREDRKQKKTVAFIITPHTTGLVGPLRQKFFTLSVNSNSIWAREGQQEEVSDHHSDDDEDDMWDYLLDRENFFR